MAGVHLNLRIDDTPSAQTLKSSLGRPFIALSLGHDITVYTDSALQARAIAAALTLAADTIDPPDAARLRLTLASEVVTP